MALPGILHARILRPPRPFAKLVSIPDHPGLVRDGSFAGVLAEREEDAIEAAKKLRAKAVWSDGPTMPQDIYAWLKDHVAESKVEKENADPAAKARGVKRLQAEYRKPFICHASIGPSCALAWMKGDTFEVWSHTQGIFNLRKEIALVLRMPEEKVIVQHAEGAGCYGHNGADDVALDSLGAFGNVFAIESFMDELADGDPVAFRLKHLKDPRGRAVLEEAVRKAGPFKKAEGRGHGVAYARYKNVGAYCAVVAEVEVG